MPYESKLQLTVDGQLDLSQRETVIDALGLLKDALNAHAHEWTTQEEQALDKASKSLERLGLTNPSVSFDEMERCLRRPGGIVEQIVTAQRETEERLTLARMSLEDQIAELDAAIQSAVDQAKALSVRTNESIEACFKSADKSARQARDVWHLNQAIKEIEAGLFAASNADPSQPAGD